MSHLIHDVYTLLIVNYPLHRDINSGLVSSYMNSYQKLSLKQNVEVNGILQDCRKEYMHHAYQRIYQNPFPPAYASMQQLPRARM